MGFEDLTQEPETADEIVATHETLIAEIGGRMPDAHRQFLISFEECRPDRSLLGLTNVQNLPIVHWRHQNLGQRPLESAKTSSIPQKRIARSAGLTAVDAFLRHRSD